jgi:hypothetical protein
MRLISIYFLINTTAYSRIAGDLLRQSNNDCPEFTDEELMTVYLFGIIQRKYSEKKDIYQYTQDHLLDWFPKLPKYEAFSKRLNRISQAFMQLMNYLYERQELPNWLIQAGYRIDATVDSLPIMLVKGSLSDSAKVATEIANKGYCATKKTFYHGLKAHSLNIVIPNELPKMSNLVFSAAAESDNTIFKEQIAPCVPINLNIHADKAYHDASATEQLKDYDILMSAIQKRKRGQAELNADQKLMNTIFSSIRQPIESFFNWVIEKTDIQVASKVRSTNGLLLHIYGKIAAALIISIFNF